MKKSLVALALVAAFAVPAFAEDAPAAPAEDKGPHTLTANVGFVSDYIFRGITQSQHKPALQGGFDYSHASGFYIGTWASNVNWVRDTGFKTESSMEWDFYAGFKGTFADDFSFDVGVLEYYYPGTLVKTDVNSPKDTNSTELYGSFGWKFITLKYSHTVSQNLFGWYNYDTGKSTRGSGYLDLTANYDLGDGWGVNGHVGRQIIHNYGAASYTDWKLGATKDIGFGVVGVSYSDTNGKSCGDSTPAYCWNSKDAAKGVAVLSFNKTF